MFLNSYCSGFRFLIKPIVVHSIHILALISMRFELKYNGVSLPLPKTNYDYVNILEGNSLTCMLIQSNSTKSKPDGDISKSCTYNTT